MATDDPEPTSRRGPTASVVIELDSETGAIRIERRTALGTVTEHVER
ncbi:hypothetical protein SAMN04487949_1236 [Halogranum gelatinilyticum]|jgi:hypothetical protein|uniref:Uncharacterized protein n=1 Tax=Halogranum gelatinilyticum TaxID=660521 RepID=A0A1G9R8P2_9EURY|nr:hypothetical protein [Halogranum gelatinilyticum]SDM19656.1 hypothetical protein SAMN04487949_1236 [Halogranum gelatinilyticum]